MGAWKCLQRVCYFQPEKFLIILIREIEARTFAILKYNKTEISIPCLYRRLHAYLHTAITMFAFPPFLVIANL